MKDLFQARSFKIFIFIAILLIALMLYSATTGGRQNVFSSVFSFIATPVQKLSAMMSGSAGEVADNFASPAELKKENEALKEQVRQLTADLIDYEQLRRENQIYREVLAIKEENQDFQFVPGSVIARDSSDIFCSFTIDKGSAHQVGLYDPVMTADGIVGFISEVGVVSSKVTTILDASIQIGSFDRRTDDNGVVTGDATLAKSGMTKIKYLQRDCDVAKGDIIVTSGLGGIFPRNLPIGEVVEVKSESQDISRYATIRPTADVTSCRDILVLISFEGQGTQVDKDILEESE